MEIAGRIAGRLHELAGGGGTVRSVLEAHLQGLTEFEPFYARLVMEERLLAPSTRHTLVAIQSAISFRLSEAAERDMQNGIIRRQPVHMLFNTWIGLIPYYLANGDLFAPGGSVLRRHGNSIP